MAYILVLFIAFMGVTTSKTIDDNIIKELDATWAMLTKTVIEGDFEGYSAVYHPDAVLVSGYSKDSYSISKALAGWKKGFEDTKAGKMKAGAYFKFTQRLHNEETAHETGMFHYFTIDSNGKRMDQYVHMNALLVKKEGKWLLLMEYQKGPATKEEWDAL